MFKNIYYTKLKKDPWGFIGRVFYKLIIGPLKYGNGDGYDAQKYWQDRLRKYGPSLKGAGDEGRSERENEELYNERAKILTGFLKKGNININKMRVLDVGCGSGFYTRLLNDLGVKNYLGIDITDTLFPKLKKEFPNYRFEKKDITSDKIKVKFDLIIMIDVVEHIVNDDKFESAMNNIKTSLSRNGTFMIVPIWNRGKKHLFYVRSWALKEIKEQFSGYTLKPLVPFIEGNMLIIRKNY